MRVKTAVRRILFPCFVRDEMSVPLPEWYRGEPGGAWYSFGAENPDRAFYVIWRPHRGAGFFSNFTQIVSHIVAAEKQGLVPVVDQLNFPTLYNVAEPVEGRRNAWEYYFEQPGGVSLDEVYRSARVFVPDGNYPRVFPDDYRTFFETHFSPRPAVVERIERYREAVTAKRTLGIHFRGKEMNYAPRHPFAPTAAQIFRFADQLMEEHALEQIFLVTEDECYREAMARRYGSRLLCTDAFRSRRVNSYNLSPRPAHRYLLGLEILADAELLALCTGLLASDTGPAAHAARRSRSLEFAAFIDNGVNAGNYVAARFLWPLKRILPAGFGGLPGRLRIFGPGEFR